MIDVKALRAICDAASPGPWEASDTNAIETEDGCLIGYCGGAADDGLKADAAFIAAARTALPAALDELEQLQRERDARREGGG